MFTVPPSPTPLYFSLRGTYCEGPLGNLGWLPDYEVHTGLAPTWAPMLGGNSTGCFPARYAQWTISPPPLSFCLLPVFQALWPCQVPGPLLGQARFPRRLVQGGREVVVKWGQIIMISLTCHGTCLAQADMFLHLDLANQFHLLTQRHRASACSILNSATCWMGSSSSTALLSLPCF